MVIGRKIIHLDVVDSTNNYVANLIKAGQIDSGTVILADEQFAGKGQRDAKWSVRPGENLTFSFFLDSVNLSVDRQFVLTQYISLALIKMLEDMGMNAKIKWPNDAFVDGKKIAGVLIENQLAGKEVKRSVLGVGLNVNQLEFEGFEATSLQLATGKFHKPMDVLYSFITRFNEVVKTYSNGNWSALQTDYLDHLYQINEPSTYADAAGEFTGTIRDVLSNGLLVMDREGEEKHYDLKEIRFL